MPSYIIYRDPQPGRQADLAAPLAFFPPLGSDELFDALRVKYPHLKTHSERVGQATMEFFLEEDLSQLSTPQAATSTTVSPWEPALPSFCSEASTWSSPDAFGPATPLSSPKALALSRQHSTTMSPPASGVAGPPALEQMTSVFSLADSTQPKQHVRRKMTESEKVEYRKRRLAKACDKCAKRKRKCTHNQDGIEIVASKTQKIAKPNVSSSAKKTHQPSLPKIKETGDVSFADNLNFDDPSGIALVPPLTDLDLDFPHAPLDEFNFDDFLSQAQPTWPWSDTADWTLLDPTSDTIAVSSRRTQHLCQSSQQLTVGEDYHLTFPNSPSHVPGGSHSDDDSSARQSQQWLSRAEQSQSPDQLDLHEVFVNPLALHTQQGQQDIPEDREDRQYDDRDSRSRRQKETNATSVGLSETASDSRAVQRSPSLPIVANSSTDLLSLDERRLLVDSTEESQDSVLRRHKTPRRGLGVNNAPGSSKGMLQQNTAQQERQGTTLGDGVTATVDPRIQLFMLKRGIRNGLLITTGRNDRSSTPGSMLRLQTIPQPQLQLESRCERVEVASCPSDLGMVGLTPRGLAASGDAADAPVHTRPRTPSASGFDSGQLEAYTFGRLARSEERLSDHVRYRDHFGRVSAFAPQALQVFLRLVCLLGLLSVFASHGMSLSMVLLAAAMPAYEGRTKNAPMGTRNWFSRMMTLC